MRPSPIFLAFVALTAFGGALAWLAGDSVRPLAYAGVFILVIAGWLVSLCLHEFGHALTAWRFGDHDVEVRGYLTLDPRRYSHPVLSLAAADVVIALGGIGLPGAAVYLRTSFMSPRHRTLVSLAGPAANLLLAVLLLALTRLFFDPDHLVLWAGVAFLGFLAAHRGAAEPAADPRPGRLRRPGTAFESGDPARAGTVQAVRLLHPAVRASWRRNQWFFGVVSGSSISPACRTRWWVAGNSLTRFWSRWF